MNWGNIAQMYMTTFEDARLSRTVQSRLAYWVPVTSETEIELPEIKLDHLLRMTDDTGMYQHAIFGVPNYDHGYTLDDNVRALQLAVHLESLRNEHYANPEALASRYLAFVWHAFNEETGRFRNFMRFDRTWIESVGSEDSHGRALWALGDLLGRSCWSGLRNAASQLFNLALPSALETNSPRAWAFALLGISEYLQRFPGDLAVISAGRDLIERLVERYHAARQDDWHWFEDSVTYSNASLPHALLAASRWSGNQEAQAIGLEALKWLVKVQTSERGLFSPVGSNGFYPRGGEKAAFDQQPIEAGVTVSAVLEAYRITADKAWIEEAYRAFSWFIGNNDLGLSVYDPDSGGCRDGLHPDRPNMNQGAESTLAYLTALVDMRQYEQQNQAANPVERESRIPVAFRSPNGNL
jgi:hypothetical protein